MADQLKEIFNADTYLNSFSGASKTIVTTNSTTQYMIKDVQVGTNTIPGTEALTVNGVQVATSLAASVSGAEIVDVSSTVALQLPATPAFTKTTTISMNAGYNSGSLSTEINTYTAAIGSNSSSTTSSTSGTALSSSLGTVGGLTTVEHWFVGSDFYYWTSNGNEQWAFYKRTGGINGTETLLKKQDNTGTITQNPGNYGWVLYSATANKFYLYGTNRIVVTYDPTNNTSSSVATSAPSHSSYYRATLSNNGLIFVIPNYNLSTVVYAVNPATGFFITFNNLYDWNNETGPSTGVKLFVYFSGTQYFIWRAPDAGGIYWYKSFTNPASIPTFPSSSSTTYNNYVTNDYSTFSFSSDIASTIGGAYLPESYGANNATYTYIQSPSSSAPIVRSFNMVTGVITPFVLTGFSITSGRGFKSYNPSIPATGGEIASTTNFPQLIRLRVTGVETTL